jgi:hypothetical protein
MEAHGWKLGGAEEEDWVSSVGEIDVVIEKGDEAVLSAGTEGLEGGGVGSVDAGAMARDVGVMTGVNSDVDEGGEGGKDTTTDSSSSNDNPLDVNIRKEVSNATSCLPSCNELRAVGGVGNEEQDKGKGGNGLSGDVAAGTNFLDGDEGKSGVISNGCGRGVTRTDLRLEEEEGEIGVNSDGCG